MAITLTLNGTTTLDESAGLQAPPAVPIPGHEDNNDNDVNRTTLPTPFSDRLFDPVVDGGLFLSPTFPNTVGVAESPSNFIQISATGNITGLSFTDEDGNPLVNAVSGLKTLANVDILLSTDSTNDNIVLGTANGVVVFAAYIEEVENTQGEIIGAQIWMVTFAPIQNITTTNHDEATSILADTLFVTAAEELNFDLSSLASGQHQWNVFGDQDNQIIVNPDTVGQTVNTSQGGGSTTIANSNQLMDGVGSSEDANGNAMVFTFVKGEPDLFNGDFGNPADIEFVGDDALQTANEASWSISQTQGGSLFAEATITALLTAQEEGANFVPGFANDTIVPITSVTVTGAGGFPLLQSGTNRPIPQT